ncbi:MAG TPA: stalk domain-containing protein [Terriglobales bacterium]|nr:stalk domain-containing protein [Terriglobales bacterium]
MKTVKMKRLLVVLLVAGLVVLSSLAEESVWRMWFNDEAVYLSEERPAIVEDDKLYLPADAVLTRLGATHIYDADTETYTVFKENLILAFNMRTNQVITSDERFLFARVFYRNKVFYLPADFILEELGGQLSTLPSGALRITTGRQRLTDGEIAAVEASMTSFQQSETGANTMYFLIRALPGQVTNHLRQLSTRGVPGAFFFTASDIAARPAALREVYVAGQTIGLYVPGGTDSATAIESLGRAQALMERAIKTSTCLVLAPGGSAAFYRELTNAGFVVWDVNFDTAVEAGDVSLASVAGRIQWKSAVYFDGTAASVGRLSRLLDGYSGAKDRVAALTEGVKPVRYGG